MLLNFFAGDSNFFGDAFFGSAGFDVTVLSASSTVLVLQQPETGVVSTTTGFGFTFDSFGEPTGGTIRSISFSLGQTALAIMNDVNWSLVALAAALDASDNGNITPLNNLWNASPLTINGAGSSNGLDMNGIDIQFTTQMTIVGSIYDDDLIGGSGSDRIEGRGGSDQLRGEGGNDTLLGGFGIDTLRGGTGNDLLRGGSGNDILHGNAGSDRLEGGDGNDTLFGELGFDRLFGGAGADLLKGGNGRDILHGGLGNDRLKGGGQNDTLFGEAGNDRLFGGGGSDLLKGGNGRDILRGNLGNDRLEGGGQNDRLFGDSGNDRLFGNLGQDILNGGRGADELTGGFGADRFVFNDGYGRDTIKDFTNNVDTIQLDDALWTGTLTKQQVINQFATVVGGDIVFDFGTDVLTIEGFTNLSALRDDMDII